MYAKMGFNLIFFCFSFGVKEIKNSKGKVIINLSYSPKKETLERKFGNLPIEYVRSFLDTPEEVEVFEKACKRFKFSLPEEDASASGTSKTSPTPSNEVFCVNEEDNEFESQIF